MDINLLLKAGMHACGRVLKVLPKDGPDGIGSPKQYMMEVLREETLPSINILHALLLQKTVSTADLLSFAENVHYGNSYSAQQHAVYSDDRYLKFRIPSAIVDEHEIMSIKSCVPVSCTCSGIGGISGDTHGHVLYGNKFGRTSSADLYGRALGSMVDFADRQLMGSITRNFRFYFFEPNILAVTQPGMLNIEFCLKHDENLLTVEDTAWEGIRQLFILDLRKSIYNEYGNYTEISTTDGEYNMHIEDWSSAESERNELYKEYRAKSHFRHSSMRS